MKFFDKIPLVLILIPGIVLGAAPFFPQPHLLEKLTMLAAGTLVKPVDIFDLFWHAFLPIVLIVKIARILWLKKQTG